MTARLAVLWLLGICASAAANDAGTLHDACVVGLRHLVARETIQFPPASSRLPGRYGALIDEAASLLAECPESILHIEGHTDDRGDPDYNLALSTARADAVADAFVARGIRQTRLRVRGYGGSKPIADNATRDGRRMNRRITLRLERPEPQRSTSAAGTENRTTVSRRPGAPAS